MRNTGSLEFDGRPEMETALVAARAETSPRPAPVAPVAAQRSVFESLINSPKRIRPVWLFNVDTDKMWDYDRTSMLPYMWDESINAVVGGMEELCLLVAREDHLLVLREKPDPLFVSYLREHGISPPEILTLSPGGPGGINNVSERLLHNRQLIAALRAASGSSTQGLLLSYAVTPLEEQIAARTGLRLPGPGAKLASHFNNKTKAREFAAGLGLPVPEGRVCTSIDELKRCFDELAARHPETAPSLVLKDCYGASGKGLYLIDTQEKFQNALFLAGRHVLRGRPLRMILERWYGRKYSLNYQLLISEDGRAKLLGFKAQVLDGAIFRGCQFPIDKLVPEAELDYFKRVGPWIAGKLYQAGYWGIASIDSITALDGTIFPIIEINARFTLTTYLTSVSELFGPDKFYYWIYYDLQLAEPLSFDRLLGEVIGDELLFDKSRGEGVFRCAYRPVNAGFSKASREGPAPGRLFALIVSGDKRRVESMEAGLRRRVARLNLESARGGRTKNTGCKDA